MAFIKVSITKLKLNSMSKVNHSNK